MIPTIFLHRFEFHQRFSYGKILDVGCADCSGWAFPIPIEAITNPPNIEHITFADCDEWKNPFNMPFIRCFAEDVPLPDKSFDTVCLGDILEHVKDPDKVLSEAKRLTKDRIVITVPNEWQWKEGPNIKTFHTREYHLAQGKDLRTLGYDSTIRHPSGSCIDALDDTEFEHIHHKHFFNEDTFTDFIKKNAGDEWEYFICNIKYHQLNFVNLACMMWRKE